MGGGDEKVGMALLGVGLSATGVMIDPHTSL